MSSNLFGPTLLDNLNGNVLFVNNVATPYFKVWSNNLPDSGVYQICITAVLANFYTASLNVNEN